VRDSEGAVAATVRRHEQRAGKGYVYAAHGKPLWLNQLGQTPMSRDSFTECLFIGGPHDGRREMVADDLHVVSVYRASNTDNFSSFVSGDEINAEPAQTVNASTMEYYRHCIEAEDLQQPVDVFTEYQRPNTGWLLQKLIAGYNPQTPGEDY
jgi:hypothetical protein